ncbi:MAG TPA: Crp/Fnr family transcriptional regulator [Bacillus bacterium]|nr:Crp/Fnr family transcriptional regulator [Bacillus sp. (in: firmicutes)]
MTNEAHQDSNTLKFLGKIEILKDLPIEAVRTIDKRVIRKSFKKGEQIISEFEEARGVFFVLSGIVKLSKQDEQGNEMTICIKKSGGVFAEACLFNKSSSNYPATGRMLQDGEIYFLKSEDLEAELEKSPEMAVQIIEYMSSQLHEMSSLLRDVALLDVYTKTVKTLERLAKKFGANKCNKMHIELPITIQEFASLIGSTRESVSRVFSKLKKDGVIDIRGKNIIITDWCKFCSKFVQKHD